jgi:hypothetical protein
MRYVASFVSLARITLAEILNPFQCVTFSACESSAMLNFAKLYHVGDFAQDELKKPRFIFNFSESLLPTSQVGLFSLSLMILKILA